MQADLVHMLIQLAGSFNLPAGRFIPGGTPEGRFDGGIRAWLEPGFDETAFLEETCRLLGPAGLGRMLDRFGCRTLFLLAEGVLYTCGPYLDAPNTRRASDLVWQRLAPSHPDVQDGAGSVFEYRSSLPVVADEGAFIRAFQRLAAPLFGGLPPVLREWEEGEPPVCGSPAAGEAERAERYEQSMAASMIGRRYQAENAWLDAVLTGDEEKALAALRELTRYQLPGRFDTLRGRQNLLIILNTLLRKNLERAGIHPAFIDGISREFSGRIESCITARELQALRRDMVVGYCRLIRETAVRGYSALLQGVMNDALLHLDGDASPRTLAARAGVSESYLATRFKAETGLTLSRWLRQRRVGRAKELLSAGMTTSQAAEQVGILDVSYFIRIFKRETGVTPGQYRASARETDAAVKK